MGLERRLPTRKCPRDGCPNNILTGENSVYNSRSPVDQRQVCPDCYVAETLEGITGG